ncbi:hypothetical protein OG900_10105 [Streptomyces sp. NBC_00433]
MGHVADSIEAVLWRRRTAQPGIEAEITRWETTRDGLSALGNAVAALPREEAERTGLAELNLPELSRLAEDSLVELRAVRARVTRRTVNIGVSGQSRNGKSTLLQSMTDLDDDQIPSGGGGPVTAVRSRVFHSATRREALLTLHTEMSFCADVLSAYAAALALPARLGTLDDLAALDSAAARSELALRPDAALLEPMLARLEEMRDGLGSFRPLLTGESRRIELDALRAWVTYPERNEAGADRRYLAVRDAEIHCPFLVTEVASLGLVDLPGLGEIVPAAEEHHLAGLQNDVDFVLVVKWPTDGNQLWRREDAQALELISKARGSAAQRDFTAILVNTGRPDPKRLAALEDDLLKRVNLGDPGSRVPVLRADVADRQQVRTGVLEHVLAHLADALPRMDEAALRRAADRCAVNAASISAAVDSALAALRQIITPTGTEVLLERAVKLHRGVVAPLRVWMADLAERARPSGAFEDKEFLDQIDALRADIRTWATDGFGEGTAVWEARALAEMNIDAGAAVFAERTLNAVRVQIAERFAALDLIISRRRNEFWQGLVDALAVELGPLLDRSGGPDLTLRVLAEQLGEADAQCPTMVRSVQFALDIHLDFRTRTLPRLRQALSVLHPEPAGGDLGALAVVLPVERSAKGAHDLRRRIEQLAREAVQEAAAVLVTEPLVIATALAAYGEQFEDAFIRSDESEREFRRLAESFRDQLWPPGGADSGLATVRVQRVRGALTAVRTSVTGSERSRRED